MGYFKKEHKPDPQHNKSNDLIRPNALVQAKLKMGQPGDKYEKEADAAADHVVNKTAGGAKASDGAAGNDVQQKSLASDLSSVQKKDLEGGPIQKMEEEEAVQSKGQEDEAMQMMEEEEVVQSKGEEEESMQMMEEEEAVQSKGEEEEESMQMMEEEEAVQSKETAAPPKKSKQTNGVESKLKASKGGGQKMSGGTKQEMESGFGADFSDVNIHTDQRAQEMTEDVGAQAFTHGNDVYFNSGKYDPESTKGKHLLAHELTHTIQQKGMVQKKVQRAHKPDTGWRYSPPKTIAHSTVQIQGIAGSTPDGVYGIDTKNAVENYQRKLKTAGLYKGSIDGKWGSKTDVAHKAFGLTRPHRAGYNCAGFAFKRFTWIDRLPTKAILGRMKKLAGHSSKTKPFHYKYWFWDVRVATKDNVTGARSAFGSDFHIVGGQTNGKGEGPNQVMSKNGERPVEGPKAPLNWEVKSGPAQDQDGNVLRRYNWVVASSKLSVHSSKELP